jgi:peptide/nickel transport system substrate-binding protein
MQKYKLLTFIGIVILILMASGCSPSPSATPKVEVPTAIPSQTPVPPTSTPVPKNLTICLGQEPSSLFIYNGSYSQSMWSILEAIYDGPVDYINYQYIPILLEKLPSLTDSDATISSVEVKEGMDLVDADGNLMTLQKGVKILPSGCTSSECSIQYDGKASVQMDQLVVRFKIKPGISWSDGTPLTAQDSIYSYSLASSQQIPANKGIIHRTASYTALDELSIEWKGLPGFLDQQYSTRFWLPLPSHLMSGKDPATLISDPQVSEKPVGWGPFVISEWVRGDHILLSKNPYYFRASEGLPKVDVVTFRFLGINPEESLQALINGECDVLDQSTMLDSQLSAMTELKSAGKLNAVIGMSQFTELLAINIKPSSYDDGYNVAKGDRPDIFGNSNIRKAMMQCINRDALNNELLGGLSKISGSYLSAGDPLIASDLQVVAYDPAAGAALLEQAGWRDHDNDPSTPRIAFSVQNVYPGAVLEVGFVTRDEALRKKTSEMIASDLQKCGFKVNVSYLPPEELFGPGPDGLLFGRKFDLAEFQWDIGSAAYCSLYETIQIPNDNNHWIGSNVTGYSSKEYNAACIAARRALPGQAGFKEAQLIPQSIFSLDVPAIPLYQTLVMGAARMDMCGFSMDPTTRSDLWNIELLDYGPGCQ